MKNNHHAARSAHAVLGLPDMPGLEPLPQEENGKVPFIGQRNELMSGIQATLSELTYRRAAAKMAAGTASPEEIKYVEEYIPKPHFMEWGDVEKYFDKLAANIPASELPEFNRHREWAREASETGIMPPKIGRLNLDRPERQLLWSAAIIHNFGNEKITEDKFTRHPIVKAVANSRFVDRMYNQLAYHLPRECKMTLGHPGSWFYCTSDPKNLRVNLDLCYSLMAGGGLYQAQGGYLGHFEPIAHHEIGHAKFSREYPESMQKIWKRIADLSAKGGLPVPKDSPLAKDIPDYPPDSKLSIDEYKELLALQVEYKLRHGFWNAAEDNCVNRYSVNLGDPEHILDAAQRHMGNLADSQNVFRTIIETRYAIEHYQQHQTVRKIHDNPEKLLNNLSHTVNMGFYLRNRLAPDTPEGRAAIGIDDTLLPGKDDAERAQTMDNIRSITKRIEELQPHALDAPGRLYKVKDIHTNEIHDVNFDGKVLLFNRWRNEEIEKLFVMANPMIEQIMEDKKKEIDEYIETLKNKKKGDGTPPPGSAQGPRVEGLEGETGPCNVPGSTPGSQKDKENGVDGDAPDKSEGETANSRRKREEDGLSPPDDEEKKKPQKPDDPYKKHVPRNAMPANPSQGAGNHRSALEKVVLGDGRSIEVLRTDPQYRTATGEIAKHLRGMSEKVTERTVVVSPKQYDLPKGGKMNISRQRTEKLAEQLQNHQAKLPDFYVVTREKTVKEPVTNDIVLVMDGSGSMGKGKGSRMEIAMKTAALIYDGIKKLQQQDPKNTRYRLFMSLWGDKEDWSKDKEKMNQYLIAEPGMDDTEVQKRIERVLQGINSGTQLAPAFPNIIGRMKEKRLPANKKHGMTHFIIPSDGDLHDTAASTDMASKILKAMPNATMDAFITENNAENNELRKMMNSLKSRYRDRVNTIDTDWQNTPTKVVEMLGKRQHARGATLTPVSESDYQKQLANCSRRSGMAREADD